MHGEMHFLSTATYAISSSNSEISAKIKNNTSNDTIPNINVRYSNSMTVFQNYPQVRAQAIL